MKRLVPVLCLLALHGCATNDLDLSPQQYVDRMHLTGLSGNDALARLSRKGLQCQFTSGVSPVIDPREPVIYCVRPGNSAPMCPGSLHLIVQMNWQGERLDPALAGSRPVTRATTECAY